MQKTMERWGLTAVSKRVKLQQNLQFKEPLDYFTDPFQPAALIKANKNY